MCMTTAGDIHSFEYRAGEFAHQLRLIARAGRRIEVAQRLDADYPRAGYRNLGLAHPEPMGEIGDRQVIVPVLGRRRQQADRIHRLTLAGGLDQVAAPDLLSDTDLGRFEVHIGHADDDIEDAMHLPAGAVCLPVLIVPTPAWMFVRVIGIRAGDVLAAARPVDADGLQH